MVKMTTRPKLRKVTEITCQTYGILGTLLCRRNLFSDLRHAGWIGAFLDGLSQMEKYRDVDIHVNIPEFARVIEQARDNVLAKRLPGLE